MMKTALRIFLLLGLVLFVVACNKQQTSAVPPPGQADPSPAANPLTRGISIAKNIAATSAGTAEQTNKIMENTEQRQGKDAAKTAIGKEVTTASGLRYVDFVVGKGAFPEQGDIVRVHYTGWLSGGRKFDSSVDEGKPFEFTLGVGRVIKGWDEGISTMKVGGKRRLIVPPNLGYGAQGAGGAIPPNSTLIFEVELLGIK